MANRKKQPTATMVADCLDKPCEGCPYDCHVVMCRYCLGVARLDDWEVYDGVSICPHCDRTIASGYQCLPERKYLCLKIIEAAPEPKKRKRKPQQELFA